MAAVPAPPTPFSCPRCNAQAPAAPGPQICGGCQLAFVLRAGARVDPNIRPPMPNPMLPSIKVKTSGLVMMQSSIVAPDGVLQGTLDPVTGLIPMDQSGVPFADIVSLAIWRKTDVLRVILTTLVLLPLSLLLLYATVYTPALVILSGPLALLTGMTYYRHLVVRRNYARVVGSMRMVTLQFDTLLGWKRTRFHTAMLERAGLSPSPIP
jgi:hypothetical protein